MNTETLTLVDFLLARITEDEERATWHHRLLCLRTSCDAECCTGDVTDEELARQRVCTCGYPAWVVTECEAKRRIVERCEPLARIEVRRQTRTLAGDTLRTFAAAYADHPDYRAEWRP